MGGEIPRSIASIVGIYLGGSLLSRYVVVIKEVIEEEGRTLLMRAGKVVRLFM